MQDKVKLLCDSQSAIHLAKNLAYHSKTKHIPIKYHFVRHVHKTSTFREATMVLGFFWLTEKVLE
jgi:hypothetical protein